MLARRTGMPAADGALSQLRAATDPAAKNGEFYGPRYVNSGPPVRKPILRKMDMDKAIAALWRGAPGGNRGGVGPPPPAGGPGPPARRPRGGPRGARRAGGPRLT